MSNSINYGFHFTFCNYFWHFSLLWFAVVNYSSICDLVFIIFLNECPLTKPYQLSQTQKMGVTTLRNQKDPPNVLFQNAKSNLDLQ